jgi:hypothetical protein
VGPLVIPGIGKEELRVDIWRSRRSECRPCQLVRRDRRPGFGPPPRAAPVHVYPVKDAIDLDRDGKAGTKEVALLLRAETHDRYGKLAPKARSADFDPAIDWLYLDATATLPLLDTSTARTRSRTRARWATREVRRSTPMSLSSPER